jgi:hypothetical protein
MEVLHSDLPFWSPFFTKTEIFNHPDVKRVQFLRSPVPHYFIIGTVDGVQSAMRRRYTYFILKHAMDLFKQESADSLISRVTPSTSSLRTLPDLEPIPLYQNPDTSSTISLPTAEPSSQDADDSWDFNVIPTINYRQNSPTQLIPPSTPTESRVAHCHLYPSYPAYLCYVPLSKLSPTKTKISTFIRPR